MAGCNSNPFLLFMEKQVKIVTDGEFFNVKDTLECGQVFRYVSYKKGYLIISLDKCAYCYNDGNKAVVECAKQDEEYFYNYFDLSRDYSSIYKSALDFGVEVLSTSASLGKGIRILNQNPVEALFSFMISQNNNIPRIKGIIERISQAIGVKKSFNDYNYYSFPTVRQLATKNLDFYKSVGLGYRAEYINRLANDIDGGFDVCALSLLSTIELKKQLVKIHGVGEKVANCVTLFGFHRSDSFPVDTWIEKVYVEDFKGQLKNRDKITEFFVDIFKENSGYYQQYLFYYKRSKEKTL